IITLQEIKTSEPVTSLAISKYKQYWNPAEKKGYSGTALFTKKEPLEVTYGLGINEHDNEGRLITAEYDDFYLVTVYTPNAQRGLFRLDYRLDWDKAFRKHVNKLRNKKEVIFCGDLNVAHKEIDLANPKTNKRNPGFTEEERDSFTKILEDGFVDSFRYFNKEPGQYSWWGYWRNLRARNIGWRLDYFCVSQNFISQVNKSTILSDVMGSDHCPVELVIK
ncbi:MAG: exodeoxyribonuclease III, partial [Candidatus Diapherotrites archaeon]|nr:exodeoxyribonuclease III [Candidatus Diapherotrites archaeon]